MSTPFGFTGSLTLPPAPGVPAEQIPFGFSGQFNALSREEYNLSGSGSITVPANSMGAPGAKGVLIVQDLVTGAAPIVVKYNGDTHGKELSPGGFDICFNPNPAAGITSMSFDYTGPGKVRVWVLG